MDRLLTATEMQTWMMRALVRAWHIVTTPPLDRIIPMVDLPATGKEESAIRGFLFAVATPNRVASNEGNGLVTFMAIWQDDSVILLELIQHKRSEIAKVQSVTGFHRFPLRVLDNEAKRFAMPRPGSVTKLALSNR